MSKVMTSLHFACLSDDTDTIQRLLEKNVDINKKDKRGRTPLHIALFKGNEKAVKLLTSNGASSFKTENLKTSKH